MVRFGRSSAMRGGCIQASQARRGARREGLGCQRRRQRFCHGLIQNPFQLTAKSHGLQYNVRKFEGRIPMHADRVEVSWDPGKSQWLVRIASGEEVIRRHCKMPQDASE